MTTSTEPDFLYHYTSQEGLLGILKTNKLWMTNILYLNDSSEFKHTLDLVKLELGNRINQRLEKGIPCIFPTWENMGIDIRKYQVYDDLIIHFDLTKTEIENEIYVFSFSREKSDLSQWRGYCPKGVGFCIEFETEKISTIIKKTNYDLIECVYDKVEKEKIIKTSFDGLEQLFDMVGSKEISLVNDFRKKFKDISDKEIIEFLHWIKIMDVSSYLKDESFKNEKEHRIVQKVLSNDKRYRQGDSMIIPYIEGNLIDQDGKLPISKVIVGPTPHPELSKLSVESLLKSEKYEGVEVEISKIPYRSW